MWRALPHLRFTGLDCYIIYMSLAHWVNRNSKVVYLHVPRNTNSYMYIVCHSVLMFYHCWTMTASNIYIYIHTLYLALIHKTFHINQGKLLPIFHCKYRFLSSQAFPSTINVFTTTWPPFIKQALVWKLNYCTRARLVLYVQYIFLYDTYNKNVINNIWC